MGKGNPNHDPKTGEFSSGGGGMSPAQRDRMGLGGLSNADMARNRAKAASNTKRGPARAQDVDAKAQRHAKLYPGEGPYTPLHAQVPTTHVHHAPGMSVPLNTKRNVGTDASGAYHGTVVRKGKEIRVTVPPNTKRSGGY